VLVAAGIIPWFFPVIRQAIADERRRDVPHESGQDTPHSKEPRGRRTRS
jgi:hypothetical protein